MEQTPGGKHTPVLGEGQKTHGKGQKAPDHKEPGWIRAPLGINQKESGETKEEENHATSVKKRAKKNHDAEGHPGVPTPQLVWEILRPKARSQCEDDGQDEATGNQPVQDSHHGGAR